MDPINQPKVGQLHAKLKDGHCEEVKVELSKENIAVYKRDPVYEDIVACNDIIAEKHITLQRDEDYKLGIMIQGGLDFKSPIKVYKILDGSSAAQCGQIEERDVIMEVNGTSMWGRSHDEAAEILRESGQVVRLHTGKLQLREVEEHVPVVRKWIIMQTIPLQMASLSKYQAGTSILRPNGFEVTSRDGKCKVSLQCGETEPGEWIDTITGFLRMHNNLELEHYNNNTDRNDQIVKMGWVHEYLSSTINSNIWRRKFLVLKKMNIQIFDSIPSSIEEWERAENNYKLLEMTVKVLESHTLPDQRANSFVITSGKGPNHIISCETGGNIADWTRAIHHATVEAVQKIKQVSYSGRWRDKEIQFVLDINQGILLSSKNNLSSILWRKPFSHLRHSSDDGHTKLKLKCNIQHSKLTETEDIELDDLQLAICGLECFITTKVAQLDPDFIQHTDLVGY